MRNKTNRSHSHMNRKENDFWNKHIGWVVVAVIAVVGQVSIYGALGQRVSALEKRADDSIVRNEYAGLERRTTKLEEDVVPRKEHEEKNLELERRLTTMEQKIDQLGSITSQVQSTVNNIEAHQRQGK